MNLYGYKIDLHRLYLCLPVCVHTYIVIAQTLKRGKGMGNGTEARTLKCLGTEARTLKMFRKVLG